MPAPGASARHPAWSIAFPADAARLGRILVVAPDDRADTVGAGRRRHDIARQAVTERVVRDAPLPGTGDRVARRSRDRAEAEAVGVEAGFEALLQPCLGFRRPDRRAGIPEGVADV